MNIPWRVLRFSNTIQNGKILGVFVVPRIFGRSRAQNFFRVAVMWSRRNVQSKRTTKIGVRIFVVRTRPIFRPRKSCETSFC